MAAYEQGQVLVELQRSLVSAKVDIPQGGEHWWSERRTSRAPPSGFLQLLSLPAEDEAGKPADAAQTAIGVGMLFSDDTLQRVRVLVNISAHGSFFDEGRFVDADQGATTAVSLSL